MYKIYKEGKEIGTTEKLVYIKKHPTNGCYTIAGESDGEGIALNGASYALPGKDVDGLDCVVVVECDGGAAIDNVAANVEYIADEALDLDITAELSVKDKAVRQTKRWLRSKLSEGLTWQDGKRYSITKEKQDFLEAQLFMGSLQIQKGANPEDVILKWNESGEEHTEWRYPKLFELSTDIHRKVEPLVIAQQRGEKQIREAETNEEIEAILRDFE